MKRVCTNQLMKLKLPSIGLPAIIKPQPTALIPYVKKTEPPNPSICYANSCMWQPNPDPLAIAALSIYDAVGCEATLEEYDAAPTQHHSSSPYTTRTAE